MKWKKILFWLIPAHWGLKGQFLEKAKVEWFVDDYYEKEKLLCEIDTRHFSENERKKAFLELDRKHGKIDDYTYEIKMIELSELPAVEKEKLKIEVKKKYKKILEHEYEKRVRTLKGEPWFGIIKTSFDSDNMIIEMDLDWNEYFIEKLKEMGFRGTDEEIVDSWFSKVCAILAEQEGMSVKTDMTMRKTNEERNNDANNK